MLFLRKKNPHFILKKKKTPSKLMFKPGKNTQIKLRFPTPLLISRKGKVSRSMESTNAPDPGRMTVNEMKRPRGKS